MKDVVVLLPGILGSALEKDGKSIWDVSASAIGRALFSLGGSFDELTLPSDASTGDGVVATHLLSDAHIVPFFWKIDGYAELSRFIQVKLDLAPGEDFFEFPYDWRLDNRISAQRLAASALNWLENRRHRYPDARLILVGHSMGGLVARYFLEVLNGWRDTKMLITLGTPYRGSVKALDFLANGLRKTVGPLTLLELTKVIKSFPSVYQLLPIFECVGKTEESLEALEKIDRKTIGALDVERARAGIAFNREIEKAVERNRKQSGYGYRTVPVVGTYQPTFMSALLTGEGVTPLRSYKGQAMLDGDGTVPRFSATPIELSKAKVEMFVACPHASLQNFEPVRVQMRAALEDIDISEIKAVGAEALSLDIPDAFTTGESVRLRVRCEAATEEIRALVTNLETNATVKCETTTEGRRDGWRELDAGALSAGIYRINVEAENVAEPFCDLFTVLSPSGSSRL
jgi:pimeloyl-ACP methyl ester carboxylesterase